MFDQALTLKLTLKKLKLFGVRVSNIVFLTCLATHAHTHAAITPLSSTPSSLLVMSGSNKSGDTSPDLVMDQANADPHER